MWAQKLAHCLYLFMNWNCPRLAWVTTRKAHRPAITVSFHPTPHRRDQQLRTSTHNPRWRHQCDMELQSRQLPQLQSISSHTQIPNAALHAAPSTPPPTQPHIRPASQQFMHCHKYDQPQRTDTRRLPSTAHLHLQ